jgi:hypothetical protein
MYSTACWIRDFADGFRAAFLAETGGDGRDIQHATNISSSVTVPMMIAAARDRRNHCPQVDVMLRALEFGRVIA